MVVLFHSRLSVMIPVLLCGACGGGAFSAGAHAGGAAGTDVSTAATGQGGAGGEATTGGASGSTGDAGASSVSVGGAGGAGGDGGGSGGGAAGSSVASDASVVDAPPNRDGAPNDASAGCTPACGAGQYCNGSNRSCVSCSDLSRLQFGSATKLSAPSAGPAQNQNFPREAARPNFTGLVYSFDSQAMTGIDIAFAAGSSPSWPTGAALGAPIASVGTDEAPLPASPQIDFAFLYDAEVAGRRSIYAAGMPGTWMRGVFGDPASALNASGNNYHVAAQFVGGASMQAAVGRLWWITDRSDAQGMPTVRMVTAKPTDAAAVDAPIVQANGCHTGGDLEPWVVPNGNMLFFSSLIFVGTTCSDNIDAKRRLSYTQLDPATGQQMGKASAILLHVTGFDDHAPSLTADMCSLLFASNRDGGIESDLYIAPRN